VTPLSARRAGVFRFIVRYHDTVAQMGARDVARPIPHGYQS
jgi:hypothetical protein